MIILSNDLESTCVNKISIKQLHDLLSRTWFDILKSISWAVHKTLKYEKLYLWNIHVSSFNIETHMKSLKMVENICQSSIAAIIRHDKVLILQWNRSWQMYINKINHKKNMKEWSKGVEINKKECKDAK